MLIKNDCVKHVEQHKIFDEDFDEKSLHRHMKISKLLEHWLGRRNVTVDIYLNSYA